MGWFGMKRQLDYALSTVGADRDEDGKILIYGAPIASGYDGEEVVVPDDTCYSVGGVRRSVAGLMSGTSYGCPVTVF